MKKYAYAGPVVEFGRCIMNRWTSTTTAISKSKAKSNLAYQFKNKYNRLPGSKIDLPGELVEV